jgi:hypothetical protein
VVFIAQLVRYLLMTNSGVDIAVLTPYAAQLCELRKAFAHFALPTCVNERDYDDANEADAADAASDATATAGQQHRRHPAVRLATVDNFQGEESTIVVLSLVRCNRAGIIGFLASNNRCNVALTRCVLPCFIPDMRLMTRFFMPQSQARPLHCWQCPHIATLSDSSRHSAAASRQLAVAANTDLSSKQSALGCGSAAALLALLSHTPRARACRFFARCALLCALKSFFLFVSPGWHAATRIAAKPEHVSTALLCSACATRAGLSARFLARRRDVGVLRRGGKISSEDGATTTLRLKQGLRKNRFRTTTAAREGARELRAGQTRCVRGNGRQTERHY